MSLLATLGEVREARRLLRLHDDLYYECYPDSLKMRQVGRFFVWWLIPLAAALPGSASLAAAFMVWVALIAHLSNFRVLAANTFDVLRMPSRRVLYAARLTRTLPWLLWIGLWCAVALRPVFRDKLFAGSWERIVPAAVFVVLLPILGFALYGALVLLLRVRGSFLQWLASLVPVLVVSGFSVGADALGLEPGAHLFVWPILAGVLTVALLAVHFWAIERMEPWRQILLAQDRSEGGAAASVGTGKVETVGQGGRGLDWAALYHAVVRLRCNWRGILRSGDWALYVAVPIIIVATAKEPTQIMVPQLWVWLAWLPMVTGTLLKLDHPQRLFLLGVDYRPLMLLRLKWCWASPALLLLAVVMLGLAITTGQWAVPLSILSVGVALTLFRAGWWEWPSAEVGPGVGKALLNTLGLVGLAIVLASTEVVPAGWGPAAPYFVFAGVAALLGIVAIVWKVRKIDEADIWIAMLR